MKADILYEDEQTFILATRNLPKNKVYVYDKVNHVLIEAAPDQFLRSLERVITERLMNKTEA